MNELDPDIAGLFDAQEPPPRDPLFAKSVRRRIAWIRAAGALLAGSSGLAAAAGAWFVFPTVIELARVLEGLFAPILASPWTAGGLAVAGAAVVSSLYLLRSVRATASQA